MKRIIKKQFYYIIYLLIIIGLIYGVVYTLQNFSTQCNKKYLELNSKLEKENTYLTNENLSLNKKLKIKNEQTRQVLIDSCIFLNPKLDPYIRNNIVDCLLSLNKYNIPPLLILCIIKEESGFNPLALNKSGAIGLMQIIPKYHLEKIKKLGIKNDELFFIKNNLELGIIILNDYMKARTISDALQKYVGGSSREKVIGYIHSIMNNYITLRIKYIDSCQF